MIFPVKPLDSALVDIVPSMPAPAKFAAFNALRHLNGAWRLRSEDPEIAVFRAITGEEEAATAIMLALKHRQYVGATKLRHHDHVTKNAVLAFYVAITRVMSRAKDIPSFKLFLDDESKIPRLAIRFGLTDPSGKRWIVRPTPPLHFTFSRSRNGGEYELEDFADGLAEMAAEVRVGHILEHIKERANRRNRLLYALPNGYVTLSGDIEGELREFQRNVFTLLRIYFLIDGYAKRQDFIQQVLPSFARLVENARRRVSPE